MVSAETVTRPLGTYSPLSGRLGAAYFFFFAFLLIRCIAIKHRMEFPLRASFFFVCFLFFLARLSQPFLSHTIEDS